MLEQTQKSLDALFELLSKAHVDVTASDTELNKVYATTKHELRKVIRGDGTTGRISYADLRKLRQNKKILASTTTSFSGVTYREGFQVVSPYREFVQDYLPLYDYDTVQRLYMDYVSVRNYTMPGITAETALKPLDSLTVATANYATVKLSGYVYWTLELERYTNFEDYLLDQTAIDIEAKIHRHILGAIVGAAVAPAYPGAGNFTNASNLFTLAQFLYYALRPEFIKERCPGVLVLYPHDRYNSMSALYSPTNLHPVTPEVSAYISEKMPKLKILPHDLQDIASTSYIAINACRVIPSVSEIILKRRDFEGVTTVGDLG